MAALTGVVGTGAVGHFGTPNRTIALTGNSASTSVGRVLAYPSVGFIGLKIKLPKPTISMVGIEDDLGALTITLPTPQFALTGSTPVVGVLAFALPTPQFALSGATGVVGTLTLKLPAPQLQMASSDALTFKLPTPQIAMVGTSGVTGDLYLKTPRPQLALTGDVPFVGTVQLQLPKPTISMAGTAGASGQLNVLLRKIALAMTGATGTLGTLTIAVPVVKFSASGYWDVTGVMQLHVPMLRLYATGGAPQTRTAGGSAPVANPNTLVMHTERQALSQYTNFPFNSMCRFAGTYLGASDQGIFALSGNTDNGALISAAARVGISDLGTSFIKRVDRVYVGCRADGPLVLRIITDEGATRDYAVAAPQPQYNNQLHGTHVRMGRGVEARYWQFELRNQNGSNFSVDMIELKPTKLRRRIGGRDA